MQIYRITFMALTPGPLTFSLDRLRSLWRDFPPVRVRQYYQDSNALLGNVQDQQQSPATRKFCLDLYSCVQDPKVHLEELSLSFGTINLRGFMKTTFSESAVSFLLPVCCPYHAIFFSRPL